MKKLFLMLSVIVFCIKVSFADSTCIRFPGMGESVFTRPTLSNHINTAHFKVHWAVPTTQEYAQGIANYAESAYQKICVEMGWQVPPADDNRGGDNKYDIYIVEETYITGYNAVTIPEIIGNWNYEWAPSFILLRNNIDDTSDRKVITAHEFNHATQLAYSCRDGASFPWFHENTAVWIADLIYDYNNSYFQNYFLGPNPLENPEFGLFTTTTYFDNYKYAGFLWPMFLAEWKNDNSIVKKIWQRFSQNPGDNVLTDMDYVLSQPEYESSLDNAVIHYAEWRYFTGLRSDGNHFALGHEFRTSSLAPSPLKPIMSYGGTMYFRYQPPLKEILEIPTAVENHFSTGDIVRRKNRESLKCL